MSDDGLPVVANIWHSHGGVKASYLTGKEPMTEKYMDENTAQVDPLIQVRKLENLIENKKIDNPTRPYQHERNQVLEEIKEEVSEE